MTRQTPEKHPAPDDTALDAELQRLLHDLTLAAVEALWIRDLQREATDPEPKETP